MAVGIMSSTNLKLIASLSIAGGGGVGREDGVESSIKYYILSERDPK